MSSISTPLIRFKGITKTFGAVTANRDVSFEIAPNSIHGIVGENGAGKSTIMKVLYGMYPPDQGALEWMGEAVHFRTPFDAIERGIGMVHQHFMLVPTLRVWENIILDRRLPKGKLDEKKFLQTLTNLKENFGFSVSLNANVEDLPVGHQQQVEILKLLYRNASVLILDEPTAVLTPQEVDALFSQLLKLKAQGKTILLITHKLKEVLRLTQTITVMRSGQVVSTAPTSTYENNEERLAEQIVGRKTLRLPQRKQLTDASRVLEVKNLQLSGEGKRVLDGLSLEVRAGEILGVAGVEGNGQHELIECLARIRSPEAGEILFCGHSTLARTTEQLRKLGLGIVPPDRHQEGAILDFTVQENFLLGHRTDGAFSIGGILNHAQVGQATAGVLKKFDVRPPNPSLPFRALSGGNQQKVVIGRELFRPVRCLIAAHPTRGVDIGAIEFIHGELLRLRDSGVAILLVSSELEEILALADRIVVLYEGKVQGEVATKEATVAQLGIWMTGGKQR